MQGQIELAKEHMEMGISLLEQYGLLYTNDSKQFFVITNLDTVHQTYFLKRIQ